MQNLLVKKVTLFILIKQSMYYINLFIFVHACVIAYILNKSCKTVRLVLGIIDIIE
jgi:hypothetical protein